MVFGLGGVDRGDELVKLTSGKAFGSLATVAKVLEGGFTAEGCICRVGRVAVMRGRARTWRGAERKRLGGADIRLGLSSSSSDITVHKKSPAGGELQDRAMACWTCRGNEAGKLYHRLAECPKRLRARR